MKKQTVYLDNGQVCLLVQTLGDKAIVQKSFEYWDSESGTWYDDWSSEQIMVDRFFYEKPKAKIEEGVKTLMEEKTLLEGELKNLNSARNALKFEITHLSKTQIEQDKFILNKTDLINAKSLAMFPRDRVMPILKDSKDESFRGLKLSMEMKISEKEERYWGYRLYRDHDYGGSQFLDPNNGILINPTEEEIDAAIIKRLNEQKWEDSQIAQIDDKYLNEALKARKDAYLAVQKEQSLKNTKEKIDKLRKELEILEGKVQPEGDLPYPA